MLILSSPCSALWMFQLSGVCLCLYFKQMRILNIQSMKVTTCTLIYMFASNKCANHFRMIQHGTFDPMSLYRHWLALLPYPPSLPSLILIQLFILLSLEYFSCICLDQQNGDVTRKRSHLCSRKRLKSSKCPPPPPPTYLIMWILSVLRHKYKFIKHLIAV